jgi:hypothetical protein
MKTLNWITWVSAGIGSLFLLLGLIQILLGLIYSISGTVRINAGRLFGDTEIINFFIASGTFFIIAVFILIIKSEFRKK